MQTTRARSPEGGASERRVPARERGFAGALSGHLPGLDGLRGLAILLVMAHHYVGDATAHTASQGVLVKLASYGLWGVDLFFVLSGFLITGLLLEAKGKPGYFRNFYARRTLRIFPLYYAVLLALFVIFPLVSRPSPLLAEAAQHQPYLWTYTSNFFIAARSSWDALNYVSHFWSLAVEEHFYLVWPLVVFSFRRQTLEQICLGVILAGLGLRIGLAVHGVNEMAISVLTPCRVDTLCLGGLLALRVRREELGEVMVRRSGRAAALLLVAIVGLAAFTASTHIAVPVLRQVRGTLVAMLCGALTLASLRPAGSLLSRPFASRPLRFFGTYSYGLYVYHGLLTWFFVENETEARLDALVGDHWLALLVKVAIGVVVPLLVSIASFELFEKRFLALKRFFVPRPVRSPASEGAGDAGPVSAAEGAG